MKNIFLIRGGFCSEIFVHAVCSKPILKVVLFILIAFKRNIINTLHV